MSARFDPKSQWDMKQLFHPTLEKRQQHPAVPVAIFCPVLPATPSLGSAWCRLQGRWCIDGKQVIAAGPNQDLCYLLFGIFGLGSLVWDLRFGDLGVANLMGWSAFTEKATSTGSSSWNHPSQRVWTNFKCLFGETTIWNWWMHPSPNDGNGFVYLLGNPYPFPFNSGPCSKLNRNIKNTNNLQMASWWLLSRGRRQSHCQLIDDSMVKSAWGRMRCSSSCDGWFFCWFAKC